MKCRNIIKQQDGSYNIVWFGSSGKNTETGGKLPAENYIENNAEMVSKSLTARLGIIQGELWYSINYGLPLFNKIRNKAINDAAIVNIINAHPAVRSIINYKSSVDQKSHVYSFYADIDTVYNETINISSEYLF